MKCTATTKATATGKPQEKPRPQESHTGAVHAMVATGASGAVHAMVVSVSRQKRGESQLPHVLQD